MRHICFFCFALMISCLAFAGDPYDTALEPTPTMANLPEILLKIDPLYPASAVKQCQGGEVAMEFSLDRDGVPVDIEAMTVEPDVKFSVYAHAALRRWQFAKPPAGEISPRYSITFAFPDPCRQTTDGHAGFVVPVKTQELQDLDCPEGDAVVRFLMTDEGKVNNLRISSSDMPLLFDSMLLEMVQGLVFEPRKVDGKAVARKMRYKFEAPDNGRDCQVFFNQVRRSLQG